MTSNLYERLTPVFREVLDIDDLVLTPELSARDIAEWDSLSHIRLVVAVEQELGVRFAAGDIDSLDNVGEFVELAASKL